MSEHPRLTAGDLEHYEQVAEDNAYGGSAVIGCGELGALIAEVRASWDDKAKTLALLRSAESNYTHMRERAVRAETALAEVEQVVHDLWACIARPEIDHLLPETRAYARALHDRLCHATDFEAQARARVLASNTENPPRASDA